MALDGDDLPLSSGSARDFGGTVRVSIKVDLPGRGIIAKLAPSFSVEALVFNLALIRSWLGFWKPNVAPNVR